MLKVLIVDDESLQRKLVKASVGWKELGMEVIGEAQDGKEALALFERDMPDIVIMDINIPFINGIEVSKKIKKKRPDTQILILTAYGEFDYAVDALNFGAAAFVLKPLDAAELLEKLDQAKKSIEAAINQKIRLTKLQRENFQMEKEQFLLECLSGLSEKLSTLESCEKFRLPSDWKICIMDIRFLQDRGKTNFQEEVEEYIKERFPVCEFIHVQQDLLSVLFSNQTEEEFKVQIYSLYTDLKEDAVEKGIAGGISEIHQGTANLPSAYREVYSVMAKAIEEETFCKYETQTWHSFIKSIPYKSEELLRNLRAREYANVYEQIENTFRELDKDNCVREAAVYTAMDILVNVSLYLMESGIDITEELEQEHAIIAGFSSAGKNQDIREIVTAFLDHGIELLAKRSFSSGKKKADDAKRYIDENYYRTELSLNIVAEETGVNPSYLSNIFKKEFKYSLSRYMIKVRMEQAAFYIQQQSKEPSSRLTLSELAEEVGYTDVYYFSKSFKNYYGVSPSKYIEEKMPCVFHMNDI